MHCVQFLIISTLSRFLRYNGLDVIYSMTLIKYPVRNPQFTQSTQRPRFPSPRQPWNYQPMYLRFRPSAPRAIGPPPVLSVVPGLTVAGWSERPGFVQTPQCQLVPASQMRSYQPVPAAQM